MDIEFDPAKDAINIAKHGIPLATFRHFDRDPAVSKDTGFDYGETQYRAFGRIDGVPHCIVFTLRRNAMRLISFRRAHEKEMRRYE